MNFDFLTTLDAGIVQWMNAGLGHWHLFDVVLHGINSSPLAKGYLFIAVLWGLVARDRRHWLGDELFTLRWIGGLLIALIIARLLQDYGPTHQRPIANAALGLKAYVGSDPNYFRRLNSFPSDHAVEFVAMTMAIFHRSRLWGVLAGGWALSVIVLPRIYFAYHFPSDVIGGALIGWAVMHTALTVRLPESVGRRIAAIETRALGLLIGLCIYISAEIAVNFDNIRVFSKLIGR